MSKLSKTSVHVREARNATQLAELSARDLARVSGGVNCTWYDWNQGGWITHVGYPPDH